MDSYRDFHRCEDKRIWEPVKNFAKIFMIPLENQLNEIHINSIFEC